MSSNKVHIIGGGLAGSEAAWQLAQAGITVSLYEMRPHRKTDAHVTDGLAELVCSNSFRSDDAETNAVGLLHAELRDAHSLIMSCADKHQLPAGGALAVDREGFSQAVTQELENHPLVTIKREEVTHINPDWEQVIIASGPLTSPALSEEILKMTGSDKLAFFDAIAPIVHFDSINTDIVWFQSRYDKSTDGGDGKDYINCPMDKEQYLAFRQALLEAEQAELKDFDKNDATFFEGCLPIEELARRGEDTMRYGPLKPIGLWDPRWGDVNDRDVRRAKRAYAVVQLRQEDKDGRLWNLVGFQTNLKWGEQKRVLQMIPGLGQAEFVRFGVMHRNTFLESPQLLQPTLQFRQRSNLLAAGQITGTEGYAAAVAGGWLAGTNAARLALGLEPIDLPATCMSGALTHFVSEAPTAKFQPMPPNFGLLPELPERIRDKRARYGAYRDRALQDLEPMRALQPQTVTA